MLITLRTTAPSYDTVAPTDRRIRWTDRRQRPTESGHADRSGSGWQMKPTVTRRRALAAVGAGLTVGLAGCSGDGTDGGSGSDGGDGESSSYGGSGGGESDGGSSGGDGSKAFTFSVIGGAPDTFETLTVSVESATFTPVDGDDGPTLEGNGTSVDLTILEERDESDPLVEGEIPLGSYDAVTAAFAVEEATTADGSTAEFESTTVEQSLVIDDPVTVEASQFDASLSVYVSVRGEGPYRLESTGFKATGM